MAVTVDDLAAEVGTDSADDTPVLENELAVAKVLLDKYVADFADDPVGGVPPSIFDAAWLAVAVDAFNRRQAPNGVLTQQYDLGDGNVGSTPIRLSSDPLRSARPLLAPWCTEVVFG